MSAKREIMIDFFVRKLLLSSAKVCPDCSSAMQLEKKPIFMMAIKVQGPIATISIGDKTGLGL